MILLDPFLYGFNSTRKVSIDLISQHAKAVVKQTKNSMVVVDMPYGTYEKDAKLAYKNAKKFYQKLEQMLLN